MKRIGLIGAEGRMGKRVQALANEEPYCSQIELFCLPHRSSDYRELLLSDAIIDFSNPEASEALALFALDHCKSFPSFIVGTTGFKVSPPLALTKLSHLTPVFLASNFSVGMSLFAKMLEDYSQTLCAFDFEPVLIEEHHKHKKDQPSGSALWLKQKMSSSAPVHSIRAGSVIGKHSVHFYGEKETLSLIHHAEDRSVFAEGALKVALWLLQTRPPSQGVLGMEDYLKFHL